MRRVLVLSADLGGGHDALANGLRAGIASLDPQAAVTIENGLRLASAHLNELARESYRTTVERTPWTYQVWFWILSATALARITRWLAWRGLRRRILARIQELSPDIVVSTYPFMTAVLGKLRREGELVVPAVGLLIDSGPHDLWIAPGIDLHVTMNPADCERARSAWPTQRYYPPLHVTSARPEVDARCREPHDRDATRAAFGLPLDQPVLLVSGGSWGLAVRDRDLDALVEQTDAFIAVACGRNDELADRLEARLPGDRARVVRFTTEMPSLLASCDAALLNAGGMTCYECFALGTAVLMYEPLAGHGINAARALDVDGLAIWVRSRSDLVEVARTIADWPQGRERAARARMLGDQPDLAGVVLAVQAQEIPAGAAISTTVGRTVARRAGLLLAVATALGLAASLWAQRHAIARFDWSVSPAPIIVAVLLFSIGPLTQAVSFWTLLRLVGVSGVRLRSALAVWSWSSLARHAPTGLGSYVVRLRSVERLTATRRQVLAASAYEQALVPVAGATFSAIAFVVAGSHVPRTVAIVGGGVLFAARPRVLGDRLLAMLNRSGESLPQLPRGRGLVLVLALNLAGWVATGSAAATVLAALTHGAPAYVWVLGAYAFAWLVGYLTPLAPGGLGVREGVLTSLLAPHYGLGVAVSLSLGLRVVHTAGDLLASTIIEVVHRLGPITSGDADDDADGALQAVARQLRGLLRSGVE